MKIGKKNPGANTKQRGQRLFHELYSHLREDHFMSPRELASARTLDDLSVVHDLEHKHPEQLLHKHRNGKVKNIDRS